MYIALLSDIHSNIFALDAVFADFKNKKIDKIIVCGDMIGYYYWPKKVINKLLNDDRVICISGNHEKILKKSMSDDHESSKYKEKYGSGYEFCINQLSASELDWVTNLPEHLNVKINNYTFSIAHGSLENPDKYIYPDISSEILEKNHSKSDFTILGHTHYPFLKCNGDNIIINPGSVGQPRDISRIASYVLINTKNRAITFRRVRFEIDKIISAAKKYDPEIPYLRTVLER